MLGIDVYQQSRGAPVRAQDRDSGRAGNRSTTGRPVGRSAVTGPAAGLIALQRAAGNAAVAQAVEQERHQHDAHCAHAPAVQRRSLVHEVLRRPGSPLDTPLRTEMEARFEGADFSGVRVHSDTVAQRSALEINAKAYTSGPHIVDGGGMSKEDWAHELTHYLDQQAGPVPGKDNGSGLSVSDPGDFGERRAVEKAREVMSGPAPVQRTTTDGESGPHAHGSHAHGPHAHGSHAPGPGGTAAGATRAPADAAAAVQRTVWKFNGSTRTHYVGGRNSGVWHDETDERRTRTTTALGLDPAHVHHGDKYDDTTRQLHGSGNIAFSKRGTFSDDRQAHEQQTSYVQRERRIRQAVVEAKQRMATAMGMLQAAAQGAPNPTLLHALHRSFPFTQTLTAAQLAPVLAHIIRAIGRVQAGLNAQGAEIAVVGTPSLLDINAQGAASAGAVGWVEPSLGERLSNAATNRLAPEHPLPSMDAQRGGPINLNPRGDNAWFVIHEATHRFAGSLDYQYSPYDFEISEDAAETSMAAIRTPAEQSAKMAELTGRRAARPSDTYTGQDERSYPVKQQNWYAMGRRSLMNADSYAQLVLTATGATAPL
ncbi:DUF4157 domain-containing protein [Streptomyces sp. NPDC088766]|uniref:eCIS core domain-containing protein n=1 Tax=Streptomyces sp. NPDC088766 TaxID=3365893 RepID=UPI00380343CC